MLLRILAPLVDLREEEGITALLMFANSFLAMAGYNVVKPATRSQFIESLGADNLPYVQLVAGLIMGFVIQGYTSAMRLLPRRWVFAATQGAMVGLLLVFWTLFKTEESWVSVAFYLWGVLAGSLLISQFWSLANDIYDARQAKRVPASSAAAASAALSGRHRRTVRAPSARTPSSRGGRLGGIAERRRSSRREKPSPTLSPALRTKEKGMSRARSGRSLIKSKHFQIIAPSSALPRLAPASSTAGQHGGWRDPGKDDGPLFANVIFIRRLALHHSDDVDVAKLVAGIVSRAVVLSSRSVERAC
jgi:hypothetical protein